MTIPNAKKLAEQFGRVGCATKAIADSMNGQFGKNMAAYLGEPHERHMSYEEFIRMVQAETLEGASMVLVQKNGPTNQAASELRHMAARLRAEEKH